MGSFEHTEAEYKECICRERDVGLDVFQFPLCSSSSREPKSFRTNRVARCVLLKVEA